MKQIMQVAIVLLFAAAAQATVPSLNTTEITKLLATTPKCAVSYSHSFSHVVPQPPHDFDSLVTLTDLAYLLDAMLRRCFPFW